MIRLNNNNEPLVDVRDYCPEIIFDFDPMRRKFGEEIYLRKKVAKMLAKAHSFLPEGITFVIMDAWRPIEAQIKFYEYYIGKFKKDNPSWSIEKVKKIAGKYAIPPDEFYKYGHAAGCAIDLELWKNGKRLPIMARQIPFTEAVKSDSKNLPANVRATREILSDVMSRAGFVNYSKEYWHWCYGDYMWAEITKNNETIYGLIELK